jgi:hypothetical protein
VTTLEVSAALGLSPQAVHHMRRRGKLSARRHGDVRGRPLEFARAEVEAVRSRLAVKRRLEASMRRLLAAHGAAAVAACLRRLKRSPR